MSSRVDAFVAAGSAGGVWALLSQRAHMAVGDVRLVGDMAADYWVGCVEVRGASDADRGHVGLRLTRRRNAGTVARGYGLSILFHSTEEFRP